MSRYRELLRRRSEIDIKFPRLKQWQFQEERDLLCDRSLTQNERDIAMCELDIEYRDQLVKFMEQKNKVEEEIRDEIEEMNRNPDKYGVITCIRDNGTVDIGKAWIHVVNELSELKQKVEQLLLDNQKN